MVPYLATLPAFIQNKKNYLKKNPRTLDVKQGKIISRNYFLR